MADAKRYNIVRMFADERPSLIVRRNVTLETAQAHCKREDTHQKDVWFDGYEEATSK
jgi:hypothetical protein